MADNVKQYIQAGFEKLLLHILDDNGNPAGITGVAPTAGTMVGPYEIIGVQTSDIAIPEPDIVDVPGDDDVLGGFIFSAQTTPAFNIDIGTQDLTLEGAVQETNVENDGNISLGVLQPNAPQYRDVMLIGISRAKSKVSASDGVSQYGGIIVPKCNMVPLGRPEFAGRTAANTRYRVKANKSTQTGFGHTFTNATHGTEAGVIRPWSAAQRLCVDRGTGDGATVTFPLSHIPRSTSLADVRVRVNGAIQNSGVTVNVANRTLTFSVAPASNAVIIVGYEYVN